MKRSRCCEIGKYISGVCSMWNERPFLREKKTSSFFTYSGFFEEIKRAVAILDIEGVRPRERILLSMDNSSASLSMFMGSLVAGIVPIVVSPKNKTAELKQVCESCNPVGFISFLEDKKRIKDGVDIPSFSFERFRSIHSKGSGHSRTINPDETAYIVFTSGSTGLPKIIEVSHRNMLAEIESMAKAYGFTEDDRHLCILPIFHASGLYRNMFLPFHAGGFVVLNGEFREDTFWKEVASEQITFVQVVPSILRTLLRRDEYFKEGQQKTLKFIGSASAPHPVELLKAFEERFGVYVLQGYGMTEATCGITLNPLDIENRKLGTVGKPLSLNSVEIRDEGGKILPSGETGRIIVAGENITRYFEDPHAQRTREYGLSTRELDTGDMGHLDEDGFLWIESRRKDLIKRGGYRMSSIEIEAAIEAAFPQFEVCVLGVPHSTLGQDVIAFVAPNNGALTSRDVIREIKKSIASYKLPSQVRFVESLPKLGVGKVNKEKLLEIYFGEFSRESAD